MKKNKKIENKKVLKLGAKILLIIFTFLIASLGSLAIYMHYFYQIDKNPDDLPNNEPPAEVWPKETSFSLLGTGDALLHNPIYDIALRSDGSYDFSEIFTEISSTIQSHDLAYINQETVFASPPYSSYPLFNTPSAWGDALINNGFDLISLANNHSMDQLGSGAKESISYWESKPEVYTAGMASSYEKRDNIRIEEINGISYAFLSYTYGTNGMPIPSGEDYLVNLYSKELAMQHVNSVRDTVDVIIVAMHWGNEYQDTPNTYQKTVAQELADMNVDIVLGNHPHWMQPIEIIDDTVIVYSMGNFISNQMIIANDPTYTWSVATGGFVTMNINKTLYEDGTSEINISDINVELLFHYKSPQRTYKIIPFSQMNETYHWNYINLYEEHKTRMTSMSDQVTVTPLYEENELLTPEENTTE